MNLEYLIQISVVVRVDVFPGGAMRGVPRHRAVSRLRLCGHVAARKVRAGHSRRVRVVPRAVARVVGVVDDARQVRGEADLSARRQFGPAVRRRYRVAVRTVAALTLRLLARLNVAFTVTNIYVNTKQNTMRSRAKCSRF